MRSMYVSVEILAATTRVEEDREAGAQENRGREREGSGRGREAGEQGAGSGVYMRAESGSRNK